MRHSMNKWMAAVALLACAACSKNDLAIDNARLDNEEGVYGEMTPIVFDDAIDTRASVNPASMAYIWEVGDEINIWSEQGTLLIYEVAAVSDSNHATFDGGGYTLTDGATYYSSHPLIRSTKDKYKALPTPYEGQTQTADGNADHIAEYMYTYADAPCDNQRTSFVYKHFSSFMMIEATLPKTMTVTEISVIANKQVFALNGTSDVTTGVFTPGTMSNTLTLALDNVEVSDGVLNAFLATAPLEPATYILSVKDDAGNVYTSPEIVKKNALEAGHATYFRGTVNTDLQYQKVTAIDTDFAGQYILVYPNGTTYRTFSFIQTMENAEIAAASVASVSGLENLYNQSSTLYNTVIGGNYIEITGEANAETLTLTPAEEAKVALTISANAAPWANATDGQTTLSAKTASGKTYSIGVDHLVANVASDGKADLVAAFNAPDAVAMMNALRGHNVNVTFDDLINLAIANTDGFTDSDAEFLQRAFNKLVQIAQGLVTENPHSLFPAGSSLMPITLSTNAFDVFKQYHDNAAEISWRISPEKRFGLAQLGYNANADGFTASVNLPSYVWFDELNTALAQSRANKTTFVNYWAKFDNNSQYDVKIDGDKIVDFYSKLAQRFATACDTMEFSLLYLAASPMGGAKFSQLGQAYKTLAEKLDTGIQPAYIYKKVVE